MLDRHFRSWFDEKSPIETRARDNNSDNAGLGHSPGLDNFGALCRHANVNDLSDNIINAVSI